MIYIKPALQLPKWAESRSFRALFFKYSCVHERSFRHEEVRRVVSGLSLIIRLWSFGYCTWATDAVTLLDMHEPLEELAEGSLPVAKMRIFLLAYQKQFNEAHMALEQACLQFGEDALLRRMRVWLSDLAIEQRRVVKGR